MKTFIIHLPEVEQSLYLATNLQTSLKKFKIDAELFVGTNGIAADQIFEKEQRKVAETFYNGKKVKEKRLQRLGVKGCFYSHYRLWKKCAELDEPIIIFEDDVKLYRGYEPVDFTDVMMLSVCTEWSISKPFMCLLENNDFVPAALTYNGECMIGTSGYVIKPHAAKKLLDFYKNSYTAADHAMNNNIIKIEIHNKLMGRSLTKDEGKQSLTKK